MNRSLAETGEVDLSSVPAVVQSATNPPSSDLVTKLGAVYKKAHIEKSDPSGLTISYKPENGGMGITKIPFEELSNELQTFYHFDPRRAAAYDLEQRKGMGRYQEELIAEEQRIKAIRAAAEAAEAAAEAAALAEKKKKQTGTTAGETVPTEVPPAPVIPQPVPPQASNNVAPPVIKKDKPTTAPTTPPPPVELFPEPPRT